MFLGDEEIKKLGFFKQNYELVANTLILHVAKRFEPGTPFEDAEEFPGGFIGGFEYPSHISFWTKESIKIEKNMIGIIFGKQSFASRGILVFPGFVHPGFDGNLILSLICLGSKTRIEKTSGIAYIAFAKTESDVRNLFDNDNWIK